MVWLHYLLLATCSISAVIAVAVGGSVADDVVAVVLNGVSAIIAAFAIAIVAVTDVLELHHETTRLLPYCIYHRHCCGCRCCCRCRQYA